MYVSTGSLSANCIVYLLCSNLVCLGYAPTWFEGILPQSAHASRIVHAEYQTLKVGDIVPDYGFSADDYFIVEEIQPNHALIYKSDRYGAHFSWQASSSPFSNEVDLLTGSQVIDTARVEG